MGFATKIIDLLRHLPRASGVDADDLGSYSAVQRDRYAFANLLGLLIVPVLFGAEFASMTGTSRIIHMSVCVTVFAIHLFCIRIAHRVKNIERTSRLWLAGCSCLLWCEIMSTGGIAAPWAPMMVLVPILAALLLRPRDVLGTIIGSITAIALIGIFTLQWTPASLHQDIIIDTVLLAVLSLAGGLIVLALVVHHQRVEQTRNKLMLAKDHVAQHDGLTGLVNRSVVNENLAALSLSRSKVNLFLVDLDGFKDINDAYGHQIGDELLVQVAGRLRETVPASSTVARLGGDEFLVLSQADEHGNTIGWAEGRCPGRDLVMALSEPFQIGEIELQMSGSVGAAHFPADARTGDELLRSADLALYAAKAAGRNQCVAFQPEMEVAQNKRLALQNRLRAALDANDIFLHYQPQFCLTTGALVGFEALARWKDDMLGIVGPDKFVDIAEECGMITQLGEQILHRACTEALEWPAMAEGNAPVHLSVNISTLQLKTSDIVPRISAILAATGFPANRLELEITESVLIADPERVSITLNELAAMGIAIAMDDFGKGYSSLSYLQNFSLSRLKIDRSFIANLDQPNGTPIVHAIIQLAKAMNLSVVAEGVETEAQRHALADMGCHYSQGFLYAPGLPPADALKLIINNAMRTGHRGPDDVSASKEARRRTG